MLELGMVYSVEHLSCHYALQTLENIERAAEKEDIFIDYI